MSSASASSSIPSEMDPALEEAEEASEEAVLSLLEHQVRAVAWAKQRERTPHYGISGGILYLEMGLGKTVIGQTIACDGTNLVVVPKPLMGVWKTHLEDWFPERKVIYFHKDFIGERRFNNTTYEDMTSADMVVTTYDVVLGADRKYNESEAVCLKGEGFFEGKVIEVVCRKKVIENKQAKGDALLYKINWTRLLTDESHKFGNFKTKTFKAVMALGATHRWVMSGTIIRNKDTDLWALLRFIGYDRCPAAKMWNDRIYTQHKLDKVVLKMDYQDAKIVLPTRHDHDVPYTFSEPEQKSYDLIKAQVIKAYNGMMLGNTAVGFMHVLVLFTRLRQMCIAPHLITPEAKRHYNTSSPVDEVAEKELNEATNGLHDWIHDLEGTAGIRSAKMQQMIKIIKSIPAHEKILIFSTFTSALDIAEMAIEDEFGSVAGDNFGIGAGEEEALEEAFAGLEVGGGHPGSPRSPRSPRSPQRQAPPFTTAMVDGETTHRDRHIEIFKTDPKCRILLTSYKVGGEGFQLTVANHVILLEPWWTNAVTEQAATRVHRYGQNKECHIYNLYATNTIEDMMVMSICKEKTAIKNKFFGGGGVGAGDSSAPGGLVVPGTKSTGLDKSMMGRILGV